MDDMSVYKQPLVLLQVHGVVQGRNGKTVATLFGKWDESMHFVNGDCTGKGLELLSDAQLLWKRSKPPEFPTRYNLSRFAITLNELTPGLKVIMMIHLYLHTNHNMYEWGYFFSAGKVATNRFKA